MCVIVNLQLRQMNKYVSLWTNEYSKQMFNCKLATFTQGPQWPILSNGVHWEKNLAILQCWYIYYVQLKWTGMVGNNIDGGWRNWKLVWSVFHWKDWELHLTCLLYPMCCQFRFANLASHFKGKYHFHSLIHWVLLKSLLI